MSILTHGEVKGGQIGFASILNLVTSSMVKPSSATTCLKGMPSLCLNRSNEASMSRRSSPVMGSSSISAVARARLKGSRKISYRSTTAGRFSGARRSIMPCACCCRCDALGAGLSQLYSFLPGQGSGVGGTIWAAI